ncbi:MAG: M1 family metallopeptidase [Bacteroidia bacterium]|nr:M1 family metallopeptidase [Bacteroidia bacterium]
MKKVFTMLICLVLAGSLPGQNMSSILSAGDKARYDGIMSALQRHDYLNAIIELNGFIPGYSTYWDLYYNRGIARAGLNDWIGARRDFILAKGSGCKMENINYLISKQALVSFILKELKQEEKLDSLREFRPVIEPGDIIRGALRPERTCFDVTFYNLTVKIIPETKSIEGSNSICFKTTTDTKIIQIDLFPDYAIKSIKWNDRDLNYTRNEGGIFIDFGETIPAGRDEKITITYSGVPMVARKPPWNGGFVWEKEKNRWDVGIACEHLGASSWWPNKDHLSDKPDSMIINVQVPAGYQGISNGNLASQTAIADGYTNFEWKVSYPINSYNVTFYMGDFVNFNEQFTNSFGSYQMDYYVLPKNLEKAKKYYTQTKEILAIYEKVFGEYPFKKDGVGMVEAPFEGMEHQGAIAIGGEYGKSNNRREYYTKDYDYLIIHELAHEWWGNAVAVPDMADAWINEGFATYSEFLFAEEKFGYPEYIRVAASNFGSVMNIWPIVGERDINSNTFLGNDIYTKGAAMLNNLRCIMNNDTLFKNMIKGFYQKYKYRIVTTSDFTDYVKDYTKADYSDFFDIFLYKTEAPILACSYTIDKGNNLTFTYRWSNTGINFTMPFCIAVSDKEYIRLTGTSFLQTYRYKGAKTFYLVNESRYDKEKVPANSFTYYWTSWPF